MSGTGGAIRRKKLSVVVGEEDAEEEEEGTREVPLYHWRVTYEALS